MNAISLLYQTVYVLGQLCLFRVKTSAVPFSWAVLFILVCIDCSVDIYHLNAVRLSLAKAEPPVLLSVAECYIGAILSITLFIAASYLLLAQRKLAPRLNKFLIALFGTELILTAIWQLLASVTGAEAAPYIQLTITAWRLAIQIQITQQTFEVKVGQAILLLFTILLAASLPLMMIAGMNSPANS